MDKFRSMSIFCSVVYIFLCLFLSYEAYSSPDNAYIPADSQEYKLGPEDTIEIWMPLSPEQVAGIALPYEAFGNELYSKNTAKIDSYGNISLPLIGEVQAVGLTTGELANSIEEKLSKYIIHPQPSIKVTDYASFRIRNRICVIGEVSSPGVYTMPIGDTITLVEAVSLAGGYVQGAYLSNVIVAKKGSKEGANFTKIDFNKALKGNAKYNVILKPGDVVYVPKSLIAHIGTFVEFYFSNTDPILKYYLNLYDVRNVMRKWN
jgi:protein involved in polysaccharide export with SLBB domain